ncbi:cell division protein ZapA [Dyella caseinilytica]|uniref:Cell division protein ZapA n=1 Tax=Dyella caseinilytica TaxID=1849581 RepID=A0ABX7GR46_9GAMM|nr:cell division protein ZapA [Dyella caseinilytica]QRN52900.1 cell division protein ZapA [Dyella caseinilytica]GGA09699.1 cell division protein ZapA [Dyella caseinilytica]
MADVISTSTNEPVALRLIDREFLIACPPEEREGLLEAANFLDRKMRELRTHAKTPGFDRLAVLAAISITHEYLQLQKRPVANTNNNVSEPGIAEGLATLRRKLEAALDTQLK